jgi:hypothetical protein
MFSIRFTAVSAALSVLLVAGVAEAAPKPKADDATAKMAAAASPMSAQALEAIYAGKTWKWKDGGGFFSADRHKLAAWSQKGKAWSYGEGRWYATDGGKLCMQAYWRNKSGGGGGDTSCFLHREKAGVWYIFRNNPPKPTDEAQKLVRGDLVSKGLMRIKASAK